MKGTKAIILAAGRGHRLGTITARHPKCLTPLAGRTLLEWQLAALLDQGIQRVSLVGGYRIEQLRGRGYEVIENPRWRHTNIVGSLCCARGHLLAEPCLVVYSDIVFHPRMLLSLLDFEQDIGILYDRMWLALWQERFEDPLQDAETFRVEGSRLIEIGRRARQLSEVQGQYIGLLRFSPAGWRTVEHTLAQLPSNVQDRLDLTSLLDRMLGAGAEIAAFPVEGGWCEVDREQDLRCYARRIARVDREACPWQHDWRWN